MPNAVRHSEIESDPVRDSPLFASHYSLKSPGMRHKAGLNSLSFYISTYKTMNAVNQPDFSRFPAVASRPHVRSSPESRSFTFFRRATNAIAAGFSPHRKWRLKAEFVQGAENRGQN